MNFDPALNAERLAVLTERAYGDQFTTIDEPTLLISGDNPYQYFFPVQATQSRLRLSWTAMYRGAILHGEDLIVDASMEQLGLAATYVRASEIFDLIDLRLATFGGNPNTYAPTSR